MYEWCCFHLSIWQKLILFQQWPGSTGQIPGYLIIEGSLITNFTSDLSWSSYYYRFRITYLGNANRLLPQVVVPVTLTNLKKEVKFLKKIESATWLFECFLFSKGTFLRGMDDTILRICSFCSQVMFFLYFLSHVSVFLYYRHYWCNIGGTW